RPPVRNRIRAGAHHSDLLEGKERPHGRATRSGSLRPGRATTTPNPHIPTTGSNGHHQVTPPSPTTPTFAITARPAITVTPATSGFHTAGAGRSSTVGVSNRPITSTTSPVRASSTSAHTG